MQQILCTIYYIFFSYFSSVECQLCRRTWTVNHILAQSKCRSWRIFVTFNTLLVYRCRRWVAIKQLPEQSYLINSPFARKLSVIKTFIHLICFLFHNQCQVKKKKSSICFMIFTQWLVLNFISGWSLWPFATLHWSWFRKQPVLELLRDSLFYFPYMHLSQLSYQGD